MRLVLSYTKRPAAWQMSGEDMAQLEPKLLEIEGVTKIFGTLRACDSVSVSVSKGEIHALLGENGAGKSTLVKMLYGTLQPNAGQIVWKGAPVSISSPSIARNLGIGMVFQHFSLFDALTAAENIALSLSGKTPISQIAEKARSVSLAYGLPLDPDAMVGDLSVGERQRIEIIRCLLQDPELIILDEPTSVLTPQEADRLFETLERLRAEGKSILYISHRLDEVRRICDRATVLRHGKVVSACDPRQETPSSLARMMVGSEIGTVERSFQSARPQTAQPLLSILDLSQAPSGPFSMALKGISLDVYPGEVVGIAGVAGNGQGELFDAISGERQQAKNEAILIRGKPAGQLGVSQRRMLGAGFVPEERLGHGAVPSMSLSDNLFLSRSVSDRKMFTKGRILGLINRASIAAATKRIAVNMDVRKSAEDPDASALSGGNLQKFLIGRELDRSPSVLVINQPTWGVDAGACAHIRQSIVDLARNGAAVLLISQDLDELFEMCDKIAVMNHGQLSDAMPAQDVTLEQIGLLMGGVIA
jgi:general nucleoside transport system ATP-binding protein